MKSKNEKLTMKDLTYWQIARGMFAESMMLGLVFLCVLAIIDTVSGTTTALSVSVLKAFSLSAIASMGNAWLMWIHEE